MDKQTRAALLRQRFKSKSFSSPSKPPGVAKSKLPLGLPPRKGRTAPATNPKHYSPIGPALWSTVDDKPAQLPPSVPAPCVSIKRRQGPSPIALIAVKMPGKLKRSSGIITGKVHSTA